MSTQDAKVMDQGTQEVKLTAYSWVIAVLCLMAWAVSFISRNVWSTALPVAAPALGLSMTAAGGLMTAFYFGYVGGNFLTGPFVDKIGPRKTLAIATLFTGLFTLLIPFANSYGMIFALRVGAGISSGPLFACGVKYQLGWFPAKARATAMGLIMSGPTVGQVLASGGFAPIINSQGWRAGFTWAGIVTLVIAVAVFLLAKEGNVAPAPKKAEVSAEKKAADTKNLMALIFTKQFILGSMAQMLSVGAMNGFTTWIITFFTKTQGFTLPQAGAIFAATGSIGLVTGIFGGFVSDFFKTRKKVNYVGNIGLFIFITGLLLTKNVTFLWAFMFGRVIFTGFAGNVNTMQAEYVAGPYAGRAMGIYNGICQLGSVIYPVGLGLVLDMTNNNYFYVLMTVSITYLVIAVIVFFMKETIKVEPKKVAA